MRHVNKNWVYIIKAIVAIVVAVLMIILLTSPAIALSGQIEPSSKTGTASIAWVENPNSGGGSDNDNDDRTTDVVRREPSPQEVVSIPDPDIPLGKLPETGGNYLIPLLLISVGVFLLLVYVANSKGKEAGDGSVDIIPQFENS